MPKNHFLAKISALGQILLHTVYIPYKSSSYDKHYFHKSYKFARLAPSLSLWFDQFYLLIYSKMFRMKRYSKTTSQTKIERVLFSKLSKLY